MHSAFSLETFVIVLILLVYIFTSHYVEIKKVPYLHESVVAILMGVLTAIFAKVAFGQAIQFDNQIFFTFILPPIIFAAGYNLRKSLFFQNFGIISFLGVIGTIISFIVISGCVSFLNIFIYHKMLSGSEVLLISSVLCATDTVAALSLVKQQKFPVLNAVLFGEGIVNDAVAIIIFRSVSNFASKQNQGISFMTVLMIFGDFLYLLFFSLAVGVLFGLGLSYFLKRNISFTKFPIKETSLILLTGYSSYLFSELINLSGIISLFTCSVIMGHYCYLNISEQSQRGTVVAFDTVGYLAEAFVFAYLGICVLGIQSHWNAVGMAALLLLVLPLARAMSVYILPLSYLICSRDFPLNSKQLKVCWYSGLIRGAIAFALCLQIESPNQVFLKTVTLVVVLTTTILGSIFLQTFSKFVGMQTTQSDELYLSMNEQHEIKQPTASKYAEIGQSANKPKQPSNRTLQRRNSSTVSQKSEIEIGVWQKFEQQYMKPIFAKDEKTFEYQENEKL